MESKLIRVDGETHEILRLEALRQTFKKTMVISVAEVLRRYAKAINKKHKLLKTK